MNSRVVALCACLQVLLSSTLSEALLEKIEAPYGNRQEAIERTNENSKGATIWHQAEYNPSEFRTPWFSEVPLLPIVFASSPTLPDGPCKKQSLRYLTDLKNGTLWAARMYDASTKYPDGLLGGYTRHFGDFDGCYYLKAIMPNYDDHRDTRSEEISGRYCLVDIEYKKQDLPPIRNEEWHNLAFDPNDSVWEAIREKGDFRRVKRYILQLALCVPEVCSFSDVEKSLQEPLKKFGLNKKLSINVSVKSYNCQSLKDSPEFSLPAKIYCWVVVSLITLIIISTWFDVISCKEYIERTGSIGKDLMLCFSARRNFNTIMKPTRGHSGFETIHLMRYFYLTLTIIGHRILQYSANPVINGSYIEWVSDINPTINDQYLQLLKLILVTNILQLYTFPQSMIILGGPLVVEGFFSFSGLILSYNLLIELDLKRKINLFFVIIIRFFRLTPSYILVLFFNALLLHHLGTGPYWEWKVGRERDNCLNNWWTNLLYINNYVNPKNMCMFQSWYVAVDYHLYIMASIVTYIFWRMPRKFGYIFLCLIILGGCCITFVNTYVYNVQPLYKALLKVHDLRDDPYFTDHYVKTHERISSYFVGVLAGAILYDHSRNPWRLHKILSQFLFILCIVVFSLGSELYGHKFLDPNEKPTALESAMYASLNRCVFAISACGIPVLITIGDGLNFHYNFLTPRWVQPLARLTYGAYLIHTAPQLYDVGVTRIARTFSIHNIFWDYIPDVVLAFTLSLLLALITEGPFRRIEKLFLSRRDSLHLRDTEHKTK